MLSRTNRLTKDKEFDLVFKKGRSSYNKISGIKLAKNEIGLNRLGILVSNKVSKKATERNKIKRQIRAAFRKLSSDLSAGGDFVIIAFPDALRKDFREIETSIAANLKKLGVIKK